MNRADAIVLFSGGLGYDVSPKMKRVGGFVMSEQDKEDKGRQRDAIYQVSTNRNAASHRVRYVESSAPTDGECRLCVGNLTARDETPSGQVANAEETATQQVAKQTDQASSNE